MHRNEQATKLVIRLTSIYSALALLIVKHYTIEQEMKVQMFRGTSPKGQRTLNQGAAHVTPRKLD